MVPSRRLPHVCSPEISSKLYFKEPIRPTGDNLLQDFQCLVDARIELPANAGRGENWLLDRWCVGHLVDYAFGTESSGDVGGHVPGSAPAAQALDGKYVQTHRHARPAQLRQELRMRFLNYWGIARPNIRLRFHIGEPFGRARYQPEGLSHELLVFDLGYETRSVNQANIQIPECQVDDHLGRIISFDMERYARHRGADSIHPLGEQGVGEADLGCDPKRALEAVERS